MAYRLVSGDIVEVKYFCYDLTLSQVSVNVCHYRVDNVIGGSVTDVDAANQIVAAVKNPFKDILNPQATFYGVTVQKIFPGALTFRVGDASGAGPGTNGGDPAPAQLSLVITKQTALAGRSKRGRLYVSFPPVDAIQADATPTLVYDALAIALATVVLGTFNLTAGFDLADLTPIIWSRTALAGTPINNFRVNDKFGTQRRRGLYGQVNVIPPF